MFKPNLKGKAAVALAGLVTAGSLAAPFVLTSTPASADPQQLNALVGVGSDTVQDVSNALSGYVNGNNYTPIQGGSAAQQIISFDALNPNPAGDSCITPKVKGATFYRPNGSTEGRQALSRAIDGGNWNGQTAANQNVCGGAKSVSGLVDFARSSSGPASGDTGTALTYIPFGRDGVSFAYYVPVTSANTANAGTLTRAQLTTIYTTTTPQVFNNVTYIPCGIQSGSGTFKFWNTVTTASSTQEGNATAQCNALPSTAPSALGGRIEENNLSELKSKGDNYLTANPSATDVVFIVGFSGAQFIAQSNGAASSTIPTVTGTQAAGIGAISNNGSGVNLGLPYTGTAPNLAPNTTFYGDGIFGRNVYFVVDSSRLNAPGSLGLKALFVSTGGTSSIPGVPANQTAIVCQPAAQQNIVNKFGFLTPPLVTSGGTIGNGNCGSTTQTGSLIANAI